MDTNTIRMNPISNWSNFCRYFLMLIMPITIFLSTIQIAHAHAYSASFTTLQLSKSQTKMTFELDEVSVIELAGGDVNNNGMLEPEEFEAIKDKILSILKENIILKIDGQPQNWSKIETISLNRKGDATQLRLEVLFPAITPSQSISFTDNLYQNEKITNYVDLLKVSYGKQNSTAALSGSNRTWSMILSENDYAANISGDKNGTPKQQGQANKPVESQHSLSTSGWLTFMKLGINHILEGYDHILFLLSLLIARQSFKQIATVITAFTIAHSLTLTLTVLGIINIPPSIVEPAIAISICYVALENIFRKKVSYRWVLSFLFGLIHGMGFADILTEMHIPKSELAIDLASFNIGIEIIQLLIVVLLLPLLTLLHRSKYSRKAIISVSTIAFLLGGFWLIERLLS
ncbi:HupE/UreJ family protein [Neobacillus sp. NPDC058068]|uniref:HupE/UreJ family protein n=1 Tax=Neobacillus sp. NPDC058068 TaxID=3346325 RepID=UPI0036DDF83C